MAFALRLRWEWLRRSNPNAAWTSLPSKTERSVAAMFQASVSVRLGDGASALFWMDSWFHQGPIKSFVLHLYQAINRNRHGTTVKEALLNCRWVRDITGAHSALVLCEYVLLWEILEDVQLQPFEPDRFVWRWSTDGQYSASSSYRSFLHWTDPPLRGAKEVSRAAAPPKVKFFF